MENGDPIELAIDPVTGAYVSATINPGGAYETTYHILSYAEILTLNQSIPVNAMLDTGNPCIVALGSDLIKEHHLRIYGCGRLDSLAIGPFSYVHQTACDEGFNENYVLLGYDFLKHFDYVFDYPHGRMFMKPNKNSNGHYGVTP